MYCNLIFTTLSLVLFFVVIFIVTLGFYNPVVVKSLDALQSRFVFCTLHVYYLLLVSCVVYASLLCLLYSFFQSFAFYWCCCYICVSNVFVGFYLLCYELLYGRLDKNWAHSDDQPKPVRFVGITLPMPMIDPAKVIGWVGALIGSVIVFHLLVSTVVPFIADFAKKAVQNAFAHVAKTWQETTKMKHEHELAMKKQQVILMQQEVAQLNAMTKFQRALTDSQSRVEANKRALMELQIFERNQSAQDEYMKSMAAKIRAEANLTKLQAKKLQPKFNLDALKLSTANKEARIILLQKMNDWLRHVFDNGNK